MAAWLNSLSVVYSSNKIQIKERKIATVTRWKEENLKKKKKKRIFKREKSIANFCLDSLCVKEKAYRRLVQRIMVTLMTSVHSLIIFFLLFSLPLVPCIGRRRERGLSRNTIDPQYIYTLCPRPHKRIDRMATTRSPRKKRREDFLPWLNDPRAAYKLIFFWQRNFIIFLQIECLCWFLIIFLRI